MISYYKKVLQNYANFNGRATRSEYWYFFLANLLISFGILIFSGIGFVILDILGILIYLICIVYLLAVFIPSLAVAIRRLHDTGRSGWWILLGFIPIVNSIGWIPLLIFYCQDSQAEENQWGPNPKKTVEAKPIE